MDNDPFGGADFLFENEDLPVGGDRLAVADPSLHPGANGISVGDDGGGNEGAEKIALAAFVDPGVEFKPFGVVDLVVAEAGVEGDLGLENVGHKVLGAGTLNDAFSAFVSGYVDAVALEGEAGVGDLGLEPFPAFETGLQFVHLGIVEIDGVGGPFLRSFRLLFRFRSFRGHLRWVGVRRECFRRVAWKGGRT